MPVVSIHSSSDVIWGLWQISEGENALQHEVPLEEISETLTNPLKRLEFLAGRVLLKELLKERRLQYNGLTKDVFGKPSLRGHTACISLSHSYPYVAAILHASKNVGIDLEQPKEKLLRIAPRVLSPTELTDAANDIVKHCVYWCAKETLIKIYGKKDLTLATNLLISPFALGKKGHLIGRIVANNTETAIPLEYHVFDSFVLVVSN